MRKLEDFCMKGKLSRFVDKGKQCKKHFVTWAENLLKKTFKTVSFVLIHNYPAKI